MSFKALFINIGKLIACACAYMVGLPLSGIVTTAFGLTPPPLPEGMDAASAGFSLMLESPLWGLVLIGLARFIVGPFWARTLILALFTWVSNVLVNQIEASFFGEMAGGFLFTIVTFLIPSILVAAVVAWLFPPDANSPTIAAAAHAFFSRYSAAGWFWRLSLAAILFMPIYYFFGLLVVPFTIEYYRQGLYGLRVPPLELLLVVMLIRSILFLLACLPILVLWQASRWKLVVFLGLALTYFVGLQPLLIANWMPWELRGPHMLEILADEFVYAWALVMLLGVAKPQPRALPMALQGR